MLCDTIPNQIITQYINIILRFLINQRLKTTENKLSLYKKELGFFKVLLISNCIQV